MDRSFWGPTTAGNQDKEIPARVIPSVKDGIGVHTGKSASGKGGWYGKPHVTVIPNLGNDQPKGLNNSSCSPLDFCVKEWKNCEKQAKMEQEGTWV